MQNKKNVLQEIVEYKKTEIQKRKANLSLEQITAQVEPSVRSLKSVLLQPGNRFILEYKTASPSKGVIRESFTADDCIKAYTASADAYSVLTDEKYFGGSHKRLQYISTHDNKPVLCKDFFIDPYQVFEARCYGADAILLMLSVLSDSEYKELAAIAKCLNLDVLTEAHTVEECERAVTLGADIIGINNRDLRDLSINLEQTKLLSALIPDDRVVISESGINSRSDVSYLAPYVNGFLIGSSLMSADNVKAAAIDMVYGAVKICGVRSKDIAEHSINAGARYLGLMFYPKSKRNVTVDDAETLVKAIPGDYVGVFVNEVSSKIVDVASRLNLSVVQLHGDETLEQAQAIKEQLSGNIKVWKALSLSTNDNHHIINQWLNVVDKIVLDYQTRFSKGGNGKSFDWSVLPSFFETIDPERIVIAGGIMPDNVSELLEFHKVTLDLSSGVERLKGEKDKQLISALFEQCRQNGVKAA
ncbi:MAG: bifunctional indole-3-glycerol-phosphate synthase TrpC/phosphoribosylanthranilate isomerase TrpF [Gammaproteobacteria bacterium]|nr:bifunctional indole-3-glycerol-phosphate synthase TrpC/phosphoribosylanthranilate isomerase TrpF [Gammaproteobacteria bacterium]